MKIPIIDASTLGPIVRATRKAHGMRQDDTAGSIGVSENFLGKVESGNASVTWAKLFQVLDGLGIQLIADVPVDIDVPLASSPTSLYQRRFG